MGLEAQTRHSLRLEREGSRRVDAMYPEIAPTSGRPRQEYLPSSWPGPEESPWGSSALSAAKAAHTPTDRLLCSCGGSGERRRGRQRCAAFDHTVQLPSRVDNVGF